MLSWGHAATASQCWFKSQRVTKGCRFCLINAEKRGNLDYDLIGQGRFHMQTMAQRQEMERIQAIARRETFATKWGLVTEQPALFEFTPALNIIMTRPGDPAHSEYAGICKQLHHLFLETMLSPADTKEYAIVLRQ